MTNKPVGDLARALLSFKQPLLSYCQSTWWLVRVAWRHQWRHQSTRRSHFPTGSLKRTPKWLSFRDI